MCGWSGHGRPTETRDDPLGSFLLFRGHHQWSNAFSKRSTWGLSLHWTELKVFIENDCDDFISSGCVLGLGFFFFCPRAHAKVFQIWRIHSSHSSL